MTHNQIPTPHLQRKTPSRKGSQGFGVGDSPLFTWLSVFSSVVHKGSPLFTKKDIFKYQLYYAILWNLKDVKNAER